MTYETYRLIFYAGAIAAVVFFLAAVILFFVLKIPKVIGDLSGATARKAIKNIRAQNENGGATIYKGSEFNKERGQLTDKISESGNIIKRNQYDGVGMQTEKISTQILATAEETTILTEDMLRPSDETTVLSQNMISGEFFFTIEEEITFIHTLEII